MGNNNSNQVWKELYKATEEDTKAVSKETLAKLSSGELDPKDQESIKAFSKKKQLELSSKNSEIIEKLWIQYDADKNGLLSHSECKKLTKDSIAQAKIHLPSMLQAVTTEQLNIVKTSMPPDMQKSFEKIMQKVSKIINTGIITSLNQLLGDADALSEDIYVKMDENKDGTVEKSEFMRNYHMVSSQLINNEQMMSELQHSVMMCVQNELQQLLA